MDKKEIQNLIKELIEKVSVGVNDVSVVEEPTITYFGVEVKEPHLFLGREGEGLYALNHIVRRILENKTPENEEGLEIMIDINGFQKKRIESLRAVAHMMAERARYFKSSVEVDPMPAFERRVVHEFLADAQDLKTESVGIGPSRRVVIRYIGSI
ncbi:MAG: R3H domain-containing nucleic acid-binding protein [Candidatus Paceibacterota bacterium]|jgi:spoIIIJ-associated protein